MQLSMQNTDSLMKGKKEKLNKIRDIIRHDLPYTETSENFNFLSEDLQKI